MLALGDGLRVGDGFRRRLHAEEITHPRQGPDDARLLRGLHVLRALHHERGVRLDEVLGALQELLPAAVFRVVDRVAEVIGVGHLVVQLAQDGVQHRGHLVPRLRQVPVHVLDVGGQGQALRGAVLFQVAGAREHDVLQVLRPLAGHQVLEQRPGDGLQGHQAHEIGHLVGEVLR